MKGKKERYGQAKERGRERENEKERPQLSQ